MMTGLPSAAGSPLPSLPISRVVVVGAGRVGGVFASVVAQTLSDLTVVAIEHNEALLRSWQQRQPPFLEQGLAECLRDAGNLHFVGSGSRLPLGSGDIVFLCISSPTDNATGALDVGPLRDSLQEIASMAKEGSKMTVVNKSTVLVGTAHLLKGYLDSLRPDVTWHVLSNPEFMSEGNAVSDMRTPHRVIIGSLAGDEAEAERLAGLYRRWVPSERVLTPSSFSAELTKLASNAMLAQRLSVLNVIAALARFTRADLDEVTRGLALDPRIGPQYLRPSFGWGGSCLEKDVRALAFIAESVQQPELAHIFHQIVKANEATINAFVSLVINTLPTACDVAVLGLAFKSGTGDIRLSPALRVVDRLLDNGAGVRVFDPLVSRAELDLSHPKIVWADQLAEACRGCLAVVVCSEIAVSALPIALDKGVRFVFDGRADLPRHVIESLRGRGVQVLGFGGSSNARL